MKRTEKWMVLERSKKLFFIQFTTVLFLVCLFFLLVWWLFVFVVSSWCKLFRTPSLFYMSNLRQRSFLRPAAMCSKLNSVSHFLSFLQCSDFLWCVGVVWALSLYFRIKEFCLLLLFDNVSNTFLPLFGDFGGGHEENLIT